MSELPPSEDWPSRRIGPDELDRIVARLGPLAALAPPADAAGRFLAECGAESSPAAPASAATDVAASSPPLAASPDAGLLDLAAWEPAIAAGVLAAGARDEAQTSLLAVAALGRSWPPGAPDASFRREFWRHCVAVSLAARMLAEKAMAAGAALDAPAVAPSRAAAWGLLHDLGKLGLMQAMPKGYARVLASLAVEGGGDLLLREREVLGVDHALFGRRMARHWGLDERLAAAVWLHHQPPDSPALAGESRLPALLVQLADGLARELGIGFSGNSATPIPPERLSAEIGVSPPSLAEVKARLGGECAAVFARLGLDAEGPDPARSPAPFVEACVARLARDGLALRRRLPALAAGARATELLAAFCRDRRADEPLSDALTALARLAADAAGERPSARRPVVAYAILPEAAGVLAVRLAGEGDALCRTFAARARNASDGAPADTAPARAEDVAAALLDEPSELLGWMDLDSAAHAPLVAAGQWVGGMLLPRPSDPGAEAALAAAAPALGLWLAVALERTLAAALGERLAEAWAGLDALRESRTRSQALAAVAEMAAGAAHEINNPLAIISGRAQLMAERASPEERKAWQLIVGQAQRISEIILSLVDLSSPPKLRFESAAAADLLAEAAGGPAPPPGSSAPADVPQAAPPTVDMDIAPELPLVRADRAEMVGVLRELLANAASAGARRVVLGAREEPPAGVVLSVADDGPGMDPATREAAFTPLFSRQKAGRKLGLGLARARRIVEAHGGRIWIRSRPGEGATVYVLLPAAS